MIAVKCLSDDEQIKLRECVMELLEAPARIWPEEAKIGHMVALHKKKREGRSKQLPWYLFATIVK